MMKWTWLVLGMAACGGTNSPETPQGAVDGAPVVPEAGARPGSPPPAAAGGEATPPDQTSGEEPVLVAMKVTPTRWTCAGGRTFEMTAGEGEGELFIKDGESTYTLSQRPAGSGTRHVGENIEMYTQGDQAMFKIGEEEFQGCKGTPLEG